MVKREYGSDKMLEDKILKILNDNKMGEYGVNINWDKRKSDAENTAKVVKSLLECLKNNKIMEWYYNEEKIN